MQDWNRNGKIDAGDHAFTAFMIDQVREEGGPPTGCCGTTAAMFLIGIILPVVLVVVTVAY